MSALIVGFSALLLSQVDLAGATQVEVGQEVILNVGKGPDFDNNKTISENVELLRAWLGSLQVVAFNSDELTATVEPDVQIKFEFGVEAGLAWQIGVKFKSENPGLFCLVAMKDCKLSSHWIQVGPAPPPVPPVPPEPEPGTAPWPSNGLSVLILRESQTTAELPVEQRAIFTSVAVQKWLKENATAGHRIWDDDYSDVDNAPKVMQDAFAVLKDKELPVIGISNGTSGFVGPLPANPEATLKLLEEYK